MRRTCSIHRLAVQASWLAVASALCHATEAARPEVSETNLIAILESESPSSEKAIACKKLAVHGSSKAVQALGELLDDPQLSSWARIALETIPGSAADEELIEAMSYVEGMQLVGVVNSIGARRSAGAVDHLIPLLQSANNSIATAAALALGEIADDGSSAALQSALKNTRSEVHSAVAEACVRCAEQLLAKNSPAKAIELYDAVRARSELNVWVAAATRGAILADEESRVTRLTQLIRGTESQLQTALFCARELQGTEITILLANSLDQLTADRQELILLALADRDDPAAHPATMRLLDAGSPPVQVAASRALAAFGDENSVEALISLVESSDDSDVRQAATRALAELPGQAVEDKLLQMARQSQGDRLRLLIQLIGERRIDALPLLVGAAKSTSEQIRAAAWLALGETIEPDALPLLIEQVTTPRIASDSQAVAKGLRSAAIRMPDQSRTVQQLAPAVSQAPPEGKAVLLETIADVEGSSALAALADVVQGDDPQLKDVASASLGKWRSIEAAPVLLEIAKNDPESKYRVRALRGYIRMARQFDMTPDERMQMCEEAFKNSNRPEERALILDALRAHPSFELLTLINESLDKPFFRAAAPQIIATLIKYYPDRTDELMSRLEQMGFEASELPRL